MIRKKLLTLAGTVAVMATVVATNVTPVMAYTVQAGDTLGTIAAQNNISVERLCELNGISNANQIWIGETLKVSVEDNTTVSRLNGGIGNQGAVAGAVNATTANIPMALRAQLKGIFDVKWYAEKYPDVVKALGNNEEVLFAHFLRCGIWEGRQLNPDFNVNAYASAYGDLQRAFANDNAAQQIVDYYSHYVVFGIKEERSLTTVEAVVAAGIPVKNVATSGNVEVGTVIAEVPVYTAPEVVAQMSFAEVFKNEVVIYEKNMRDFLAKNGITLEAAPTNEEDYADFMYSLLGDVCEMAVALDKESLIIDICAINDEFWNRLNDISHETEKYPEMARFTSALSELMAKYPAPVALLIDEYEADCEEHDNNAPDFDENFSYVDMYDENGLIYVANADDAYNDDLGKYERKELEILPDRDKYVTAKYDSLEEADAAYKAAWNEWLESTPDMDDYMNPEYIAWNNKMAKELNGKATIGVLANRFFGYVEM